MYRVPVHNIQRKVEFEFSSTYNNNKNKNKSDFIPFNNRRRRIDVARVCTPTGTVHIKLENKEKNIYIRKRELGGLRSRVVTTGHERPCITALAADVRLRRNAIYLKRYRESGCSPACRNIICRYRYFVSAIRRPADTRDDGRRAIDCDRPDRRFQQ